MKRCLRHLSPERCLSGIPWHLFQQSASRCGQPVTQGSQAMSNLAALLGKKQLRMFFVIPIMDGSSPLTGFDALAKKLFGRILHVPQDSTSPQDYIQALMDIADQLSKQYVIRVQPNLPAERYPGGGTEVAGTRRANRAAVAKAEATLRAGTLKVAVRRMHVWNSLGGTKVGAPSSLLPIPGGRPECPSFVAVTANRTLLVTNPCGDPPRRVHLPQGELVRSAIKTTDGVLVISASGKLLSMTSAEGDLVPIKTGLEIVKSVEVSVDGALAVLGLDKTGRWIFTFRGAEEESFEWVRAAPVPTSGEPPPLLFTHTPGKVDEICLLINHEQIKCSADRGAIWWDTKIAGLPASAIQGPVQLLTGSDTPRVHLIASADGSVYRSVAGSRRWQASLPPAGGKRNLILVKGRHAGVCARGQGRIICSDDMGARWFSMGGEVGDDSFKVTTHGHEVFLVGAGRFYRLDRVANRELASSNIYFGTGSDRPQASLIPFLRSVAIHMLADNNAFLRVEGHADQRGSDSYNEELALRRAKKVATHIASFGVDSKKMTVLTFGERRPVRAGKSAEDLARNRRVEILLMQRVPKEGWKVDLCTVGQEDGVAATWEERRRAAISKILAIEALAAPSKIIKVRKKLDRITQQCARLRPDMLKLSREIRQARDMGAKFKLSAQKDAISSKLKLLFNRIGAIHMTDPVKAGLRSDLAAARSRCAYR